jgi:hypothetical protein
VKVGEAWERLVKVRKVEKVEKVGGGVGYGDLGR